MELRANTEEQTANLAPNKVRRKKERPILRLACRNVRTLCTGLDVDLVQVDDGRKTAITDCEFKMLNIAALQETRLSSVGSIKEQEYAVFWKGKNKTKNREAEIARHWFLQ